MGGVPESLGPNSEGCHEEVAADGDTGVAGGEDPLTEGVPLDEEDGIDGEDEG